MKQSTLMSILNFVTIGLALLLVAFFLLVMLLNTRVLSECQNQLNLTQYAQQFIDASERLTEKVRAYAASGDSIYYDEYNQEVDVDRSEPGRFRRQIAERELSIGVKRAIIYH